MAWKLSVVLAFAIVWLAAPAVRAESDTPECCDYNGLYAGIGGGYAIEDFDGGNSDNGSYVNLRLGYRFLDFVALEALGEFEPEFDGKSGRYTSGHTSIWSGFVNAKVYPAARWTGFVQPYLLAGGGWMWGDTKDSPTGKFDDNGFAGRFGLGIDFFITEHVFLTTDAAYLLPATGDGKALDQVLVGGALQYRF
jgi:opacity protein-like surface antigen